MAVFMDLTKNPEDRETAKPVPPGPRHTRRRQLHGRRRLPGRPHAFATWFHGDRKKFMSRLMDAAQAMDP